MRETSVIIRTGWMLMDAVVSMIVQDDCCNLRF